MANDMTQEQFESRIKALEKEVANYKSKYEALQNKESLFEVAMESLPFDFFAITSEGRYVFQNAVCREHWGGIIGKRVEDIDIDKETQSLWQSNNQRAFAGEVVKSEVNLKINGKDGIFYSIISPIREKNRVKFVSCINMDITEQNSALQILKENEEKFHAIFDLSPQAIAVTELETGKLVDVNKRLCEMSKSHHR